MKRSLIPAAILLSLAGAAQAEMSVYGLLDFSVGKSVSDDEAVPKKKVDINSGGDGEGNSVSRFGLKGSTDVGSGFKGNFRLESNGIASDGSIGSQFFQRAAWFGLSSSSLGEARVGRQDSVSFQTLIDFDLNGFSNGVPASFMNLERGRQSRSLQYISPTFGGAKVQLGFVPKGNQAAPDDQNVVSVGASFATGPIAAGLAVESKRTEAGTTYVGAAGSYDLKVVKLVLGGARDKTPILGSVKLFSLGAAAPVAGITIGAQVGRLTGDSKRTDVEVFVNKEVLKNTTAYFEAGHQKYTELNAVSNSTKGTGFALGVIYVF
jgi:predicted porin